MGQPTYLGSGPLGLAAASLVEPAEVSRMGGRDPAAFLASLMDLRGSVDLAQRLPGWSKAPPVGRTDAAGARSLRALIDDRLGEVRSAIERVYKDPFQRRNKLPSASDLHASLAPALRAGRVLGATIELCWGPFGALVAGAIDRARFEVQVLREEIAPRLRELGPLSNRLERIDAALGEATAKGRQQIFDRLIEQLGRSFARALRAAIARLPEASGALAIEPWFRSGAWIRGEIEAGRRLVLAAFEHERSRLVSLVDSACPGMRG
ncbi:MAG: hypothetical protein ABI193_15425 [Minicystis sp.]